MGKYTRLEKAMFSSVSLVGSLPFVASRYSGPLFLHISWLLDDS